MVNNKIVTTNKGQIYKEIMEMKNKNCELDTICISVLKQLLAVCIETTSQIVNIPLTPGVFCIQWKTAIV